ncbi:Nup133 N terminal like-domain-containing protein [Pelagophyceae sp. CCMP2097]|nr:Nup133 N terminal like-domain-containing protein [Pelagophyceae sp. CCMP2097]
MLDEDEDWRCLGDVEHALVERLRRDETGVELCDQLAYGWAWGSGVSAAGASGAHRYYTEPYASERLGLLAVRGFAPWPQAIEAEARRINGGRLNAGGLLPEIERAWVAIGTTLVLWDYRRSGDFAVYEGLTEPIVSVCVAAPRPHVFVEGVRHVLVVCTTSQVSLLALIFEDDAANAAGTLRVLPTEFGAETDDEYSVAAATRDGRVFFGGRDGFVHEFEYANRESLGAKLGRLVFAPAGSKPDALGGDRKRPRGQAFAGYQGFTPPKCAKRDACRARVVATAVLPPFMRKRWLLQPLSFLGLDSEREAICKLAVDDARGALFSLSISGTLDVYDVGPNGDDFRHVGRLRVVDAAKRWCAAHSQRDTGAPQPALFSEPARPPDAKMVAMHVVSPLESTTCHLVVVDEFGFRFYVTTSMLGSDTLSSDGSAAPAVGQRWQSSEDQRPVAVTLLHVRAPPPQAAWAAARGPRAGGEAPKVDFAPSVDAHDVYAAAPTAKVGASFYAHGVFVNAVSAADGADRLLATVEDGMLRGTPQTAPRFALREAVCELGASGAQKGEAEPRLVPRVWALLEACPRDDRGVRLRALAALSRTPADLNDSSAAKILEALCHPLAAADDATRLLHAGRHLPMVLPDHALFDAALPLDAAALKAQASWPKSSCPRRPRDYAAGMAQLSELAVQHVVGERRLLALSRAGVEELAKVRPLDHMREALTREADRSSWRGGVAQQSLCADLAAAYGLAEACCMAFTIACGADLHSGAPSVDAPQLRRRALAFALEVGGRPRFERVEAPSTTPATAFSFHNPHSNMAGGFSTRIPAVSTAVPVGTVALVPTTSPTDFRFVNSGCHDALVLLTSRLLRPVWLKPVFWLHGGRCCFLLDRAELLALRPPLAELRAALRDEPSFAVATRHDLLATDSRSETTPIDDRGRDAEAARREARATHCLYRLVSRATQALALLDVLARARDAEDRERVSSAAPAGPGAPTAVDQELGKVGSTTLRDLVCSRDKHAAVRGCLRALTASAHFPQQPSEVAAPAKPRGLFGGAAAAAAVEKVKAYAWPDALADELRASCYLYFNAGDARAHAAAAHLAVAAKFDKRRQHDQAQSERDKAVEEYDVAASEWLAPGDAVGTDSALAVAAQQLERAGRGANAVRICLICASNFSDASSTEGSSTELTKRFKSPKKDAAQSNFSWELGLYRGAKTKVPARLRDAARQACEDLAVAVLKRELEAMPPNATESLDSADVALREATLRPDLSTAFVERVFETARQFDERRLLALPRGRVAAYLRRVDAPLLWRHHVVHHDHAAAAALMEELATAEDGASIGDRVGYLIRARDAATRAAQQRDVSYDAQKVRELQDLLAVAELQQRGLGDLKALTAARRSLRDAAANAARRLAADGSADAADAARVRADAMGVQLSEMEDHVSKLENRLLGASELYNDVASRYAMWELCLALMHACGHSDAALAEQLWRSLVSRQIPRESADDAAAAWLASTDFPYKAASNRCAGLLDDFEPATVHSSKATLHSSNFDDGVWIAPLGDCVSKLGRELGASAVGGGSYSAAYEGRIGDADGAADRLDSVSFPLQAIAAILQRLATEHARVEFRKRQAHDAATDADARWGGAPPPPLWPLEALLAAQCGRAPAFHALAAAADAAQRRSPLEYVHCVAAAAALLDGAATHAAQHPRDRPVLALALRGGAEPATLIAKLNAFDSSRHDLRAAVQVLLQDLDQIQHKIDALFSR